MGTPQRHHGRAGTENLRRLYLCICEHPGLNRRELAEVLGWTWTVVNRRVDSLESAGLLVSEDIYEQLYPFPVTQEAEAWQIANVAEH